MGIDAVAVSGTELLEVGAGAGVLARAEILLPVSFFGRGINFLGDRLPGITAGQAARDAADDCADRRADGACHGTGRRPGGHRHASPGSRARRRTGRGTHARTDRVCPRLARDRIPVRTRRFLLLRHDSTSF